MKKTYKRLTSMVLAALLVFSLNCTVFAADYESETETTEITIPIHNEAEVKEIKVAAEGVTSIADGNYTYEVEILGTGTKTIPKDVTDYVTNRNYESESTWPIVQYEKGESTTIQGSIQVASEAMIPFIKAKVSASAGVAHEITNTQTITYYIPYGYKGCIYYSLCLEYFSFRITTKDAAGTVISTNLGSCTGKEIKADGGYNIRLIKL